MLHQGQDHVKVMVTVKVAPPCPVPSYTTLRHTTSDFPSLTLVSDFAVFVTHPVVFSVRKTSHRSKILHSLIFYFFNLKMAKYYIYSPDCHVTNDVWQHSEPMSFRHKFPLLQHNHTQWCWHLEDWCRCTHLGKMTMAAVIDFPVWANQGSSTMKGWLCDICTNVWPKMEEKYKVMKIYWNVQFNVKILQWKADVFCLFKPTIFW